jgi:hypothetical protein
MRRVLTFLFLLPTISFAQTLPNAGFETWRSNTAGSSPSVSVQAPTLWYGFDSLIIADEEVFIPILVYPGYHPTNLHGQIYQENTIKNSGSSSAKIMTVKQDTIGRIPGLMANAKVGINVAAIVSGAGIGSAVTFSGGTGVSSRITSVSAYVEYFPGKDTISGAFGGIDTGLLNVQALGHRNGKPDTIIGTGVAKIPPTSSFTQITANIVYFDSVNYYIDTIRVVFSSGGGTISRSLDSSTLYVDDVSMTGVPNPDFTGVNNVVTANEVTVYPNPSAGVLNVAGPAGEQLMFTLFSINGRAVISKIVTGQQALDISSLPDGLYFYTINDSSNKQVVRGKVSVSK